MESSSPPAQRGVLAAAVGESPADRWLPSRFPGELQAAEHASGLQVKVLSMPGSAVSATAIFYRVGARDETSSELGAAHFLEHMMFKGSARFGKGEVDRLTQLRGGSNNAFTSHDVTAYYFSVAGDEWPMALEIEIDRMSGLTLDPEEVNSERSVIEEEISLYQDDPWDALEQSVHRRLFGVHPYGRPILGSEQSLAGLGSDELRAFHERHYRPDNAVLVVAGPVTLDEVLSRCEGLPRRRGASRATPPSATWPIGEERIERARGDAARLLIGLPGPLTGSDQHAAIRVAVNALFAGRSSRLHRVLVEQEEAALFVSGDVSESQGPNFLAVALETRPDRKPPVVETRLRELLAELVRSPLSAEEIERARRMLAADWLFAHERLHRQTLALGFGAALFEVDHAWSSLRRCLEVDDEQVRAATVRWLCEPLTASAASIAAPAGGTDAPTKRGGVLNSPPEVGAVIGWSLPEAKG